MAAIFYTGRNTVTATISGLANNNGCAYWYTGTKDPNGIAGLLNDNNNDTSTDFAYNTSLETANVSTHNGSITSTFKTVSSLPSSVTYVWAYVYTHAHWHSNDGWTPTVYSNNIEVRQASSYVNFSIDGNISTNTSANILFGTNLYQHTLTAKIYPENSYNTSITSSNLTTSALQVTNNSRASRSSTYTLVLTEDSECAMKFSSPTLSDVTLNMISPTANISFVSRTGQSENKSSNTNTLVLNPGDTYSVTATLNIPGTINAGGFTASGSGIFVQNTTISGNTITGDITVSNSSIPGTSTVSLYLSSITYSGKTFTSNANETIESSNISISSAAASKNYYSFSSSGSGIVFYGLGTAEVETSSYDFGDATSLSQSAMTVKSPQLTVFNYSSDTQITVSVTPSDVQCTTPSVSYYGNMGDMSCYFSNYTLNNIYSGTATFTFSETETTYETTLTFNFSNLKSISSSGGSGGTSAQYYVISPQTTIYSTAYSTVLQQMSASTSSAVVLCSHHVITDYDENKIVPFKIIPDVSASEITWTTYDPKLSASGTITVASKEQDIYAWTDVTSGTELRYPEALGVEQALTTCGARCAVLTTTLPSKTGYSLTPITVIEMRRGKLICSVHCGAQNRIIFDPHPSGSASYPYPASAQITRTTSSVQASAMQWVSGRTTQIQLRLYGNLCVLPNDLIKSFITHVLCPAGYATISNRDNWTISKTQGYNNTIADDPHVTITIPITFSTTWNYASLDDESKCIIISTSTQNVDTGESAIIYYIPINRNTSSVTPDAT